MVPEISHRCPSCGASVRDRGALFCPECGKPLSAKPKAREASDSPDSSTKPEAGEIVEVPPASSVNEAPAPAATESVEAATTSSAATDMKDDLSVPPAHRRGEKTRERLHRASEVARGVGRGVIEEPAKRVEKIRQASTVVIEEASYDPSLRFVLVALGLFVVFVVLLVLSKVMG
ncbi:MAG: zinc-ribbon domain-containing protein [Pyrinomonadaceae bacterium]